MNAQEINQTDAQGARHGLWQKFYEGSTQLRYEGTFDHGREVGVFKFYSASSGTQPTATKTYTEGSDEVMVAYFRESGKKISQGAMRERQRIGNWEYYHEDGTAIMTVESYTDGVLDGERITYFTNGKIAQKQQFKLGKQVGKEANYNEEGTLLKVLTYEDGQLQGLATFYNADGIIEREGRYKDNKKHGTWKYYEDGSLKKTIKFPQNKIGVQH